jgi:hypothetical protein
MAVRSPMANKRSRAARSLWSGAYLHSSVSDRPLEELILRRNCDAARRSELHMRAQGPYGHGSAIAAASEMLLTAEKSAACNSFVALKLCDTSRRASSIAGSAHAAPRNFFHVRI